MDAKANAEVIESRYHAAIQSQREKISLCEKTLATSEAETRQARAALKKCRAEFWKLVDQGPDPQQDLTFTDHTPETIPISSVPGVPPIDGPTIGQVLEDHLAKELEWRARDVRVLPISIPLVNALYAVPLETLGELFDYWRDERSLLTAGGFSPTGNMTVLDAWETYCDDHLEVPRIKSA